MSLFVRESENKFLYDFCERYMREKAEEKSNKEIENDHERKKMELERKELELVRKDLIFKREQIEIEYSILERRKKLLEEHFEQTVNKRETHHSVFS